MSNLADLPLWQREQVYAESVSSHPEPQYVVIWEDPDDLDAPCRMTTPSPLWLSMAMAGGILPPVEVYWALEEERNAPGFTEHKKGGLLHTSPPIPAMTEEEAMEYLVMKDIPQRVWRDYTGNRTILRIVPRSMVPRDRTYRNAWRIAQEGIAA